MNGPVLHLARGKTVTLPELPPFSIALDGYVQGPGYDLDAQRYSFDHHKNCIRLVTKATCEQVRDAVILGLEPRRFTVFINDVDLDTALSWWLLNHPEQVREPQVFDLVDMAGLLDAHGGAFFVPRFRHLVAWLSEPETQARKDGSYEKLGDAGLKGLLDAMAARIDRWLAGDAPSDEALAAAVQPPVVKVLFKGSGWKLVETVDPHSLTWLYGRGIERVVTVRPLDDGSYAYTVAKKSDFVNGFDVPKLLAALNAIEPGWGGGSTIGGAPRNPDGSRSRLPPERVFEIVERLVTAG